METRITWLLDEKQEESGASDLRSAIETIGDHHLTINRTEARHGTMEFTIPLHSSPTLAYGSIEFAKSIRNDFYPGKWCDWSQLRCEYYYAKLGEFLINDDYILLPASEVRRRINALRKQWGSIFMRPVRADKPFSGFVAHADKWEEAKQQLERVEAQELVVAARAKEITAEYRTVAVRGKGIVAASQYMQGGQQYIERPTPDAVLHVVEVLGKDVLDPMFVVDIAECEGKLGLLEINGFSFASFYACDLEAIVRAAHREALHEWEEMQN